MTKKRPLPADRLAECKAAHDLFLAKKTELGLSQKKIAELADMTPAAVNLYFKGINPLNAKFAAVLANALRVPVSDFSQRLADEIGAMTQHARPRAIESYSSTEEQNASYGHEVGNVTPMLQPTRQAKEYPLISWVAAGERAESPDHFEPGVADEWLQSTENAGPHGYWLQVKGKSMVADTPPSFPEGTPILVQPEGFDLISGKFYIFKHLEGETTFKQFVRDAGRSYLVPLNTSFEQQAFDDQWRAIGRVIDAKITGL